MRQPGILALAFLSLIASSAVAQVKFSATPVLQSGTTAGGTSIAYPKTDSAEVTALMLNIGPGGETGRHMHPYPTFVYVLEGAIDVEMDGGVVQGHKAGDSSSKSSTRGTTPRTKGRRQQR